MNVFDVGTALLDERRVQVRTESTLWLVERNRFMRLPLSERPRPPLTGRVDSIPDGTWLPHTGVTVFADRYGCHLLLVPAWRPGGRPLLQSGVITSLTTAPIGGMS